MLPGISTYTYGWAFSEQALNSAGRMNEHDLLQVALNNNISCIQIGDNLPLHMFSPDRLRSFVHATREKKMRVEIGARGMNKQNLETYLDIAREFAAPLLRFVIDEDNYYPSLKETIQLLKTTEHILRAYGIVLGIENHDRFKASELKTIVEQCASDRIGICLDCANSIGAGEGLHEVAETLAPCTVNLHIKDFAITRLSHKMGFTVTGAMTGTGMADIPWLINKVASNGRCRSAILEQWVIPENTIDETIEKEKQWANKGIHYLKEILSEERTITTNSIL